MPSLAIGMVTGHNPPFGVSVLFKMTGQGFTAPVIVGRDYIDALRVRQKPLPGIQTWGLVAFPNEDYRNGIWICSIPPSYISALNYTGLATDPFMDYESHFSGHWWLRDGAGNYSEEFPDGTTLVVASGSGLAQPMRYLVDETNNNQIQVPFTQTDRIPNPPSPFYFVYTHPTGTSISVDPSGNVLVSGAPGASFTTLFDQTTLTIDASGNPTFALTGSQTLNITLNGDSLTDALVLVSKFITQFNEHKHSGVTAGGGQSGFPVTALASGDVKSNVIKVSE